MLLICKEFDISGVLKFVAAGLFLLKFSFSRWLSIVSTFGDSFSSAELDLLIEPLTDPSGSLTSDKRQVLSDDVQYS